MKYLLGYDIGSSSVKAALLSADTGKPLASAFSPETEMEILSPKPGFAEQDPARWWAELVAATGKLRAKYPFRPDEVGAIGISYQMHGLVCIDRAGKPLRPAIIWCDSRAVQIGEAAFDSLGHDYCLRHFLNSPGNFTASKLKWVRDNEPAVYEKIFRVLLPGDYIAYRMTGEAATTVSGLSEGIFWDYREGGVARLLLEHYRIDPALLAGIVPTFGEQGRIGPEAAAALGLAAGIPVAYRAGDQPNNAFSLCALEPGEVAATAGTSGVIYGVADRAVFDAQSRVNAFVHVNHSREQPRYGVLMCLNGTGILNSWLRRNFFGGATYEAINTAARGIPPGAEGIFCYPFGNGAERILGNANPGAQIRGLDFNRHGWPHLARAAQEGIVCALAYGAAIMRNMNMPVSRVRAGYSNMFLSEVFADTFAAVTACPVELFDTDGALGAARGAGFGAGWYRSFSEAFAGIGRVRTVEPSAAAVARASDLYAAWERGLEDILKSA